MLTYELKENILTVTEILPGWNRTDCNKVQYNLDTWESRVNGDPFRPMTQSAIDWVKKYYLPKVQ